MLAISQNPERVSNILRSSTAVIRVSGIGLTVAAGDADVGCGGGPAMVVMPMLLRVGWRR